MSGDGWRVAGCGWRGAAPNSLTSLNQKHEMESLSGRHANHPDKERQKSDKEEAKSLYGYIYTHIYAYNCFVYIDIDI